MGSSSVSLLKVFRLKWCVLAVSLIRAGNIFNDPLLLIISIFVFLWRCDPTRVMASSFLRFFYITHNDASQWVGFLWTSDQLVAETSTWQHTTLTTDKHPCPPVGFEPTISTGERPQTYALDRAATGTGHNIHWTLQIMRHIMEDFVFRHFISFVSISPSCSLIGMYSSPRQFSALILSSSSERSHSVSWKLTQGLST